MRRALALAFEDSDDENVFVRRSRWIRIREEPFDTLDHKEFVTRFRLTKPTVLSVLETIEEKIEFPSNIDGKSAAAGRAAAGGRELEVDWSREVGIGSPVRTLSSFTSTMEVRPACRGQRAYSFTREPCTMKDYEDGWYRGPEPEWRVVWEPAERRGAWLRAHEPAPAAWGGAWGPGWGPSRGASRGYLPISHQYMSATDFRHYDTPAPSYILDETTKDKELEYRHRVQQPTIASFQSQHLPHKYAVLQVAKSFNGPAHNTPKKTTDGNFCLYTAKYTTAANTPNNIHFPNISGYRDHNDSTTVYNVRNPHQNPQMNPQYPQGSVMYNQMEPTQNPQYAQGSVMYNQMEPTQNPQYPQGSMMFNQMEPTQNPQYPQGPVMFSRMDTAQNPQHPQVSQMYNQMEPQNSQMNPQYGQGPLQYPQGNAQPSQSTSGYNAQGISHVCSRVPCNVCEGRQAPPDIIPCGPRQMTVAEIIEANSRCNLECMTKKPPPETNLNTNRTFKAKLDAMKAEEKALKKKKSKKSDVPFLKRIKYLLSGKAEERYTYHRPCYKYTRNAKTGKICIACNTNLPCECFYIQSESKTCLKCKQPLTCREVPGAIPCPTTVPGFQGPHLPCCVVENDYLSGVESDPQSPTTSRPEGNQNANGYPYRDGNRPQGPYATYFTMTSPAPRFLPRFGKCNADPAPDPDPDYSLSVHESDSVYYVSDKGSVLETYQETCMMEDNTVRDFERRNCLKEDCLRSCYRPDISQPYYVKKSPITSMIDDDRLLKYIPCIRRSNTASFSRIHRKTNTNFSYNIPANTKHNNIGYNDVKMSSTRNERREDKKKCEMSTMSSRKSYEIQMNCIQKEKRFDFKEQAQRNKFKEVKSVTLSPSSSSTSCRGGGSGGCKWRRCAGRWYRGRGCKDTYQNSIGKKNNEDSDSVIENFNAEVNFNYLRETQKQPRGKGGSGMFRQRPGRHSLVPSRAPPAPRAPLAPRAPRICSAPFTSLPT